MSKTYFISGHRNLSQAEFDEYYAPEIMKAIREGKKITSLGPSKFVVGDYYGADIMAQEFLVQNGEADNTTVYHMFSAPRNIAPEITQTKGGFKTDIERDSAMTDASDCDIAFIRKGNWTSGTAQNILRRYEKFD